MDGPGLKAWRLAAGLTLPAAAAVLGVSRATLARYEALTVDVPAKVLEAMRADEAQPGASLSSDSIGKLEPDHIADAGKKVTATKPTLAEARAIVEAAGFVVMTGAELKRLAEPAEGLAHTGPAFDRPSLTRINTPERKPPKGAVFVPTERTAGMSKNAVVRPSLKAKRVIGFDQDGKELWG